MGILCFVYFLLGCVKTVWTQLFESESLIHIYGHLLVQKTKEESSHFQTSLCLWVKAGMWVLQNGMVKHHISMNLSKYVTFSLEHSSKGRKTRPSEMKRLMVSADTYAFSPRMTWSRFSTYVKCQKGKCLACSRTEKGRLLNSACWQWLIYLSRQRHMLQLKSFSHTHCSVLLWVVCMLWASSATRQKRTLGCIMAFWSFLILSAFQTVP